MKIPFLNTILLLLLSCNSIFSTNISPTKLDYIENKGQWHENVKYKVDLNGGGTAFLEKNGITFLFIEQHEHLHHNETPKKSDDTKKNSINLNHSNDIKTEPQRGHAYNFKWLNVNNNATVAGEIKQNYYNNYFIGNDESKWASYVGIYKKIHYKNIYDNIDAYIYSNGASMKTDYIVKKGAEPKNIQLQYKGINNITISQNGDLKITTSINELTEIKPYAYQIINGKKIEVFCKYKLESDVLSFEFPQSYNKAYDLIIDPTLVLSTYSGSISDNWGSSSTNDAAGNMFLGGVAFGANYPTTLGAFQTSYAGGEGYEYTRSDIVITKFNANGTSRFYSTYLGGSGNEVMQSLYCTPQDELIILATTGSANFPTTANAYSKTFKGGSQTSAFAIDFLSGTDIALVRMNASGSALVGSTYFGGTEIDGVSPFYNYGDETRGDIGLGINGDIIISSSTYSTDIPGTTGSFQPTFSGLTDGLIARFNSNLSTLRWASYFGSDDLENANSLQIDKRENIFICGATRSLNLPGKNNGLNKNLIGGVDGYIAKISGDGKTIYASTYLGTDNYDQAFLIDLDADDNIVTFGQTLGQYPVSAGVYNNQNACQFIHKLNNNLDSTKFSTVFGTPNNGVVNISPTALMVDICGSIYAVGWGGDVNSYYTGYTFDMPITADAFQSTTDGSDFYFINFNRDATHLIYATYFGENGGVGDHVDGGTSRFDKNGVVYQAVCASCLGTQGFPTTTGAYSTTNNSDNCNMAGFKFKFDLLAMQIITIEPKDGCINTPLNFTFTSSQPATSFLWNFGDGTTSIEQFPTHTYTNEGFYTVTLKIINPDNCNIDDEMSYQIYIGKPTTKTIDTTLCKGDSIEFNMQNITTEGTYTAILKGKGNCDSTVTLNVKIKETDYVIDSSICEGQSVFFNNELITESGVYVAHLKGIEGCDSIVTLNLNVQQTIFNIDTSFCEGNSITIDNNIITETGLYTFNYKRPNQCDSIVQINAIKKPMFRTEIFDTICKNETYTVGTQTFSESGYYTITLSSNINQCDSIIYLSLVVQDTLKEMIAYTLCEGESITIEGTNYNKSGIYDIHRKSINGCDSLIILHLEILPLKDDTLITSICSGDSILVNGVYYKNAGEYLIMTTHENCINSIFLKLSLIEKSYTIIDTSICEGKSITIGNKEFSKDGQYEIILQSSLKCDSIITLNLVTLQNPIINAIVDSNLVRKGTQVQLDVETNESLNYIWQPNVFISNTMLKNPTAIVNQATWFIVEASNQNCSTIDSVFVDILILPCNKDYIFIPNAFTPNGDGVNDYFRVRSENLINGMLSIFDRWGNNVFTTDDLSIGWDGYYKGKKQQVDTYGYYFYGTCEGGETITIKGNITLLE